MKPTAYYYHTRNVVGVAVGFLQTKIEMSTLKKIL